MARPSKSEVLSRVFESALVSFNRAQSALRDERKQCLEDRRFATIPSAQWEGLFREQFENRPRLEVNKIHLSLIRIYNEYRANRITVNYVPKDGTDNDHLADTCDMLYRADEQDSTAEEAYDNAFEEAAAGGFGAWRLTHRREDEWDDDNEAQRIFFEPIYDADTSVYFDLDAKRQDKSDAKECWVVYSMTRHGYMEQWGDDPTSWPKLLDDQGFDWATPDVVYVAEYYRMEEQRLKMVRYRLPDGETRDFTFDEVEEGDEEVVLVEALGGEIVKEWTKRRPRVHKYIMSGGGILEDCGYIAGKCIPIVPVYGKRWFIDNIERCMGQVRLAKDPQRLYNMQLSKLAEISALSAVEKPIVHPEQMAGFENMWAEDNLKNWAYLLLNPLTDANGNPIPGGPVGYTKPPVVPPALAALLQVTNSDITEILGNQSGADQMVSNISADAVEMIQQRVDMQAYIFMSNMAKAMQRCGQIWLGMAQDLYVEDGRKMKGVTLEGDAMAVELMKPVIDERTGAQYYANDLSRAKMDVAVDVGPSFTSRRDALVRTLTGILGATQDPQTRTILESAIIMNLQGEGMAEFREWARKKLVSMGVSQPNEEERAAMAEAAENQQPDPNAVFLMAEAEKAQAMAVKAQADTGRAIAETEKTQAETAKTLASIDTERVKTAIDAAKAIGDATARRLDMGE